MKRLQRYYYLVGVPLLLLALGTVVFFDEIASTVRGNPHPQINYIIFVLIAAGGLHMLQHVYRINREGRLLQQFTDRVKDEGSGEATRQWFKEVSHQHDVGEVLELVLDTYGKPVGAVQHAALESELAHFKAQLQRRLLLAQFLSGLMVGMGLLGTFIGLLGALSEIGKLIGSFALGTGMTDPVAAVSSLVTRLTEPMKAMGVAFSASLFGVLGSLIMGMLGVFIKSATGELGSIVQSRVVWLTDLGAGSGASGLSDVQPLQEALSELAQHSPLLKGMTVALDQSERRVRQLLRSMDGVLAQWQLSVQVQQQALERQDEQQREVREQFLALTRMQEVRRQTLAAVERSEQRQAELIGLLHQQQQQLQAALSRPEPMQAMMEKMLQAQEQVSRAQTTQWQNSLQAMSEQMHQERSQWLEHLQAGSKSRQESRGAFISLIERIERAQAENLAQGQQLLERLSHDYTDTQTSQEFMADLLEHTLAQLRSDSRERMELAEQARRWMNEQQDRQEQLVHALISHGNAPSYEATPA